MPVINIGILIFISLALLLSYIIIYNTERNLRPTLKISRSRAKSFFILGIAFLYSFSITLISQSLFSSERLPQEYFLEKIWRDVINDGKYSVTDKKFIVIDNSKLLERDSLNLVKLKFVLNKLPPDSLTKYNNINLDSLSINKDDLLFDNLDCLYLSKDNGKRANYIMYHKQLKWINFEVYIFPALLIGMHLSFTYGHLRPILINGNLLGRGS